MVLLIKKLQDLIGLHIDISINNSGAMAMMHNDWKHLEADELIRFVTLRNAYENNFRTIIKQGINQGEIINKNPEVIVFSMLSTLQTMYLWYEKRGKMDVNILKTFKYRLFTKNNTKYVISLKFRVFFVFWLPWSGNINIP